MKNKLLFSLLSLFIATGLLFYFYKKRRIPAAACRIAMFFPAIHPSMDAIATGFVDTFKQHAPDCSFDTYNAGGNQSLLHAQAEEIVQADYNLIFTVGTTCTQTIYELCKKKHKTTPVIFTAVDDPEKMGIVHSLQSSNNNMTGVISDHEHERQLGYLFALRPSTQRVLLVYNPAQGMAKDEEKNEIKQIVEKHGATLTSVEIYQPQEIATKVTPFMNAIDAILILKDHAVVAGVESLIALCNKYGVTLYASDQHSGEKGAALAFDVSEYAYGSKAAEQAHAILLEHTKPTDIPVYRIQEQQLHINSNTMQSQGLHLTPEQLSTITAQGGIVI